MPIRWITPKLGTAAAGDPTIDTNMRVIDVRDLVDKEGNRTEAIQRKIKEGIESISEGRQTVICCDYGMSRSNAIAVGILATTSNLDFDAAVRQVQDKTGETQIKLEPLRAVKAALGLKGRERVDGESSNFLVTGGSGFIGKSLRAAIGSGLRVTAPASAELDISVGNTMLELLADEHEIDCIVHLANPRVYTSNVAMGQSLTMLRNVIEVCLSRNIRLVYISSWEVYSGYVGTLLASEAMPALPRGPYGETKYLCEALIENARRIGGLQYAMLRSSPIYGFGSDKPKFIYNFIEKAKRGDTIVTHRYRQGNPALDLLYIDDLVSALAAVLRNRYVGTLNIGTGVATSTFEIAQLLRELLQSHSPIEQADIDSDLAVIAMNSRRAQKEIGWKPAVSLGDGLARIIEYAGASARLRK